MAERKPRTVFASDPQGYLYVEVAAVMHPLVPMADGLTIVTFPDSKRVYLHVADAVAWCRKEMAFHSAEKYRVMIEVMERAARENDEYNREHGLTPPPREVSLGRA